MQFSLFFFIFLIEKGCQAQGRHDHPHHHRHDARYGCRWDGSQHVRRWLSAYPLRFGCRPQTEPIPRHGHGWRPGWRQSTGKTRWQWQAHQTTTERLAWLPEPTSAGAAREAKPAATVLQHDSQRAAVEEARCLRLALLQASGRFLTGTAWLSWYYQVSHGFKHN